MAEPDKPRMTTEHARSVLDTQGYKHNLRMCNTYYFSTATMVAQRRLSVSLHAHCLSFYKKIMNSSRINYTLFILFVPVTTMLNRANMLH